MKKILFIVSTFYTSLIFAESKLTFQTSTISEVNSEPKYEININYPQIKSPTTASEEHFNQINKLWALQKKNDFKKALKNWDTSKLPPELKANGSSITVKYDLYTVNSNQVISLRYSSDSFMVGAAHGSNQYSTINYDLYRDKQLVLADLFKYNSNYMNTIAEIASKKVQITLSRKANDKVDIFKEGLLPNEKNYSVWNFTPGGLMFTFNEYQVAAYVFGSQEIKIPFQRLAAYLNPNNTLTKCLQNNSCKIVQEKP